MFLELKHKIQELELEYSNFPEEEKEKVEFLLGIDYKMYSNSDLVLLRKHGRLLKRIKRTKRTLHKLYAWTDKMEKAPTILKKLEEDIREKNKIFCMDLEFCENTRVVTEIGISIYKDNKQETYHYIPLEYLDRRNGKYVPDNKDNFDFGDSKIIPLDEIKKEVNSLLYNVDCLVGHDFKNDKWFLKKCGFVEKTRVYDTQKIAHYYLREQNKTSLTNLINHTLDIQPEHLHNGGNDAFYTLKTLLKMSSII